MRIRASLSILASSFLILIVSACQSVTHFDGRSLFEENCANCHGRFGEGNGPASVDIGLPIPDLRYMAESNAGIFPSELVYRIIDGQSDIDAHFSRRMPIWGYEFSLQEGYDEASERRIKNRIRALTRYLESIQQTAQ